ncbi:MAG TPA: hypothetical protein VLT81_11395 [Chondromyces sp.]|nr:hypothetical protein [Chondromyces sp.]
MKRARFAGLFSTAVVILLAGAAVDAAEPVLQSEAPAAASTDKPGDAAVSADTAIKVFGVQVFIDPKTGLVRTPTQEEAAALSAEMQRQFGAKAPRTKAMSGPVVRADGIVMAQVDISLMHSSVAHILPDGTVSFDCVKGHDHALDDAERSPAGAEKE